MWCKIVILNSGLKLFIIIIIVFGMFVVIVLLICLIMGCDLRRINYGG